MVDFFCCIYLFVYYQVKERAKKNRKLERSLVINQLVVGSYSGFDEYSKLRMKFFRLFVSLTQKQRGDRKREIEDIELERKTDVQHNVFKEVSWYGVY